MKSLIQSLEIHFLFTMNIYFPKVVEMEHIIPDDPLDQTPSEVDICSLSLMCLCPNIDLSAKDQLKWS